MASGSWNGEKEPKAEVDLKEAINNIKFHDETINVYSQVFGSEKQKGAPCSSSDLLAVRFEHLNNIRTQEEQRASHLTQQLFRTGPLQGIMSFCDDLTTLPSAI